MLTEFEIAKRIVIDLQLAGFTAVFAGGCVRDRLLGVEPKDYDIATNATPDDIEYIFDKTIPVGKSFGVIVVVRDGIEFEVATFRGDGEYSDGRRPDDVTFYTEDGIDGMKADAARRDLTINGMFYDPVEDKLYDFVGGRTDLEEMRIRFIGEAHKRIEEDKLRMMRAIRFALRLDFGLDTTASNAIRENAHLINQVSNERIKDELCKMFSINARDAIVWMGNLNILPQILPEIHVMKGCEQPAEYHPEGDVFVHTCMALEHLPKDASQELIWATLLHDVGKPPTQTFEDRIRFNGHDQVSVELSEKILKRLKFSNKFIEHVLPLVGNHMRWMALKEMRKSKLKRFLALDNFEDHKALHYADCMASHEDVSNLDFVAGLHFEPEQIRPERLLTGKDLLEMGFKQGPEMGVIFRAVEEHQLNELINTREEAIEYVVNHFMKAEEK